jgi:hypothetical protein
MTRKDFLQTLALMGVAVLGGGSVISSCGQKEEEPQARRQPSRTTEKPQAAQAPSDPCSDVSGLTDTELVMRNETLKYAVTSPDPAKVCDNCKFWTKPVTGEACGGCQLIKGPIHPKGYCTSWFAMEG